MKSSCVFHLSGEGSINTSAREVSVVQTNRNGSPLFARPGCALVTLALVLISSAIGVGQVSVPTNRYDNNRTGLNDNESFLNPANVTSSTFAKLGAYNVDGYVVAQPLYMQNVSIGGALHNVVFVATQHDSLYGFDADNLTGGNALWQVSFINPAANITSVPIADQGCTAVNGYTEIGIQGTPAIDTATATLYVDVKTKEVTGVNTAYIHRLHAIDITSGQEKPGSPVKISGSVQGASGTVVFDSAKACQRAGLLLSNGKVYIGFGSNGCDTARGWLFAYDETTLQQLGVFSTAPNQPRGAAIWQGGSGLVGDSSGNVFLMTANGPFNVNVGGSDFGDSFMKVSLNGNSLNWTDYFTPYDQGTMAANDLDLGAGGALLVPSPNVLIGAGKTGSIYVVNPDNMGHFNSNDNSQIIQWEQNVLNEVDGSPALWNNVVFFAPGHGPVVGYLLNSSGLLSTLPIWSTQPIIPVGGPIISANGSSNGILWLIRKFGSSAEQISAFDAAQASEIYNSSMAGTRDTLGTTSHFVVPTVANGRVYVGTQTQLVVYGLMPVISSVSGSGQTGAAGTTLPTPLTIRITDPYTGAPRQGVTVTFAGKGTFGNPTPVTDSTGTATTTYTLPTTFSSSSILISVTSTGFVSAAFLETVTPGTPASVAAVSGGSQSATAGTTLPKPLIFKVADQYGNGVSGIAVTFSDSPNHGLFSANPVTTDSFGKAMVTYSLPTKAGFTTVTASGVGFNANMQERALAGTPTAVSILSGNNQTSPTKTLLPQQLKVKVTDQYGNVVPNVTVTYNDNGANGTFSSTTAITNSSGVAGVSYTTPNQPGTVKINATVNGLPAAIFTVTVT